VRETSSVGGRAWTPLLARATGGSVVPCSLEGFPGQGRRQLKGTWWPKGHFYRKHKAVSISIIAQLKR
jgi:hypothetical protein